MYNGGSTAATFINPVETAKNVRERITGAGLWGVPGEASYAQRTHLVSPEPFALTTGQVDLLHRLGGALRAFYTAANDLYLHKGNDWVNEYLNIGKPDDLLRHARMNAFKRALPAVIRPDVLLTEDGMVITELDSVPGGMGHLDCLSAAYEDAGFELVGSRRGMRDGFASILRSAMGDGEPVCAIVVSDESEDYRPEMAYLARELREVGLRAYEVHPRDVVFTEEGLYITPEQERLRVDVVYRFFELFDLLNIPKSELISYAARKKLTVVTPPYKPYLEEKMLLALLHSEFLQDYWAGAMGESDFGLLKRAIAPTYIMDNRPVPPHARVSGFEFRGKPIRDWRELRQGTQKERQLVLKPSGFSPLAWGSRGVKIGHDMPADEWAAAVEEALDDFKSMPWVLQPFSDTQLIGVNYYNETSGGIEQMQARVRLCPYYFAAEDGVKLGGVLATAVPKNKKIVHGMVDAVMSPCRISTGS